MRTIQRRTLLIVIAATMVVSSAVTWAASVWIRSPAEAAARTAPPSPSLILVPVVEQELGTNVVTRGTGRYGSPQDLSVTPSRLKNGPQIVTRLPRVGSLIEEGDVLLSISGRPVFALEGAQPSYRDLGPGMTGQDVKQLEAALSRAGFHPGPADGRFDAATAEAVRSLYLRHGFQPIVATDAQLAAALPREAGMVEGASPSAGVQVPSDEVAFVPATPLRVTKTPGSVGAGPSGPLVTVTSSAVVIDGLVRVEEASMIHKGAEVVIDEPDLGISGSGTVSQIASRPGTGGADSFHVSFQVAVEGRHAEDVVDVSVRLTIPIETTRSTELTVPLSAVSLGPDGRSRVQRSSGGSLAFIPVRTGLSASGYVVVTPLDGATLADGDLVVAGFE